MPTAVTITVKDNGTFLWLKNLPKHTRRLGKRETWNLTQTGARLLKESAMEAGVKDWKKLLLHGSGIHPVKISEGKYGIVIPQYGIYLDRMSPHWVSLKPGRAITEWAKSKKIHAGAIKVRPHPYINRGYRRLIAETNRRVNRIANKIVRG